MRLEKLPNIRPVGIVPQNELHRYARNWWAGMIPFHQNIVPFTVRSVRNRSHGQNSVQISQADPIAPSQETRKARS